MDDQTIQKTDGIAEQNPPIQDRTVVALFADEGDARNAEQSLIEAGYDKVVVTWNGEAATAEPKPVDAHGFWDTVKAFFGDHKDADLYGEGLRRGQTLVTVHTEQGRAAMVVDILDRFNPTDVDGAEQAWQGEGNPAAETIALDDVPAQDRPAYLAAATAVPEGTAIETAGMAEQPWAGGRDHDMGNARVRSYVPGGPLGGAGETEDIALRDSDSILNDTDEDGPIGDESEAVSTGTPNKAWLDRTHGLEDKVPATGTGAANDPEVEPKT